MSTPTALQRTLMARAALIFLLALLTGLWAAVVLSHGQAIGIQLSWRPQYERLALAAHVTGVLSCFFLLGMAWTIEATSFTEAARHRLARWATVVAYMNWAGTVLASILDARGIDFGGNWANKVVAVVLQGGAVIPGLIVAGAWWWGLKDASTGEQATGEGQRGTGGGRE